MNMKYYDKAFQNEAIQWWGSLSINQMKAFEKKHKTLWSFGILPSEISRVYDLEVLSQSRRKQ